MSYSIDITTASFDESSRTLDLTGSAGANPYMGSLRAVHAAVTGWGDGSSTIPLADFAIVSSTASPKAFSAEWSASHAYAAPGNYEITALVYHGEVSPDNLQYAAATTSVTVDPRIVASVNGEGAILPLGTTTVAYHGTQTFTITPGNGEVLNALTVDGIPVPAGDSYAFDDVTADHAITAWFVHGARNTLTVSTTGEGTGVVTSDPPGISCGSEGSICDAHFSDGATVVLTAAPDAPTSTFEGWGGACASSGTSSACTLVLSEDAEVSAAFGIRTYALSVSAAGGTGNGVISDASGTIHCDSADPGASTCAYPFRIGTIETLMASPAADASFIAWSAGPCAASTSTSCAFVIDSVTTASTVIAVFNERPVPGDSMLDVTIAGTGNGSVSSDPPGIDACTSGTCTDNFVTGSMVTLTATPRDASAFTGWSGDVCDGSTSTSCSFAIAAPTAVTASFDAQLPSPSSDISVAKEADATTVTAGGTFHYRITVANLGPDAANGVIAADTLPDAISLVGVTTSAGSYASSTGIWTIGGLLASSTAYLDMEVLVDPSAEPSTTIVNTVRASVDLREGIDPNPSNDVASTTVTVAGGAMGAPDFAVRKMVDRADPSVGGTVTYSIEVVNNGSAQGTFVVAKDFWDEGIGYNAATSSQGTISLVNGGIEWDIGMLDPHATATMSVAMTVGGGQEGRTLMNGVSVSSTLGSFIDPTPLDNAASVGIAVRSAGTAGGGVTGPVVSVAAGGGNPFSSGGAGGGGGFGAGIVLGTTTTEVVSPGMPSSTGTALPAEQGEVLGASTSCGYYLSSYIAPMWQRGAQNDPAEVKKLQAFLNAELGLNIPLTGYYGPRSEAAVRQLQTKYSTEILAPWVAYGLPNENAATGYVYKTTQRLINMLQCPSLDIPMPVLP